MADNYYVIGVIIVVAIAGKEVISYVVNTYLKKTTTDYVTVVRCGQCMEAKTQSMNDFKEEVRNQFGLIRGILLVLVTGGKPTSDDVKDLVK